MTTLYKRRIEQGLCGGCGEPNKNGGSLCDTCKEKSRIREAAKREKRKTAGFCIQCGKRKPKPGSKRCRTCLKSQREARAAAIEEFREAGLCVGCGQREPKEDCSLCQKCIDNRSRISSEHYRRRKEAGTCYYCRRKPTQGTTMCKHHLEQSRDYRFQTKVSALDAYGGPVCIGCGADDIEILEIDHIDGGGCQHRKKVTSGMGGHPFYQWLKREGYPPGYRVLCPTCNKKAHAGLPLPTET